MKPAPFTYHRPDTLSGAIDLLAGCEGAGRPLLGGQSLIPMLNLRLAPAEFVVDLKGLAELNGADVEGDLIRYGAATRHAAFEDGTVPDAANGLLRHVGSGIAYRAIRNRGTIGGSLSLADAGGDWAPVMVALDAEMEITGPNGARTVSAADFFLGPYMTALDDGDILTGIRVPRKSNRFQWGHYKFVRKAGEYATSIAVCTFDPDNGAARAVLGGIGAPVRLDGTARTLSDRPGDGDALAQTATEEIGSLIQEDGADGGQIPVHIAAVKRAAKGVKP